MQDLMCQPSQDASKLLFQLFLFTANTARMWWLDVRSEMSLVIPLHALKSSLSQWDLSETGKILNCQQIFYSNSQPCFNHGAESGNVYRNLHFHHITIKSWLLFFGLKRVRRHKMPPQLNRWSLHDLSMHILPFDLHMSSLLMIQPPISCFMSNAFCWITPTRGHCPTKKPWSSTST